MEEQLRKDKHELEMREQRRKAEDAKKIREIVRESDKNKGLRYVQREMGKLMHRMHRMHRDEQELLSVWEGRLWDGSIPSCAPRQDAKKWSTRECLRETERAPIKRGWAETDKGQPGKPNVRARSVAKE